jgi:hypothetical protein
VSEKIEHKASDDERVAIIFTISDHTFGEEWVVDEDEPEERRPEAIF